MEPSLNPNTRLAEAHSDLQEQLRLAKSPLAKVNKVSGPVDWQQHSLDSAKDRLKEITKGNRVITRLHNPSTGKSPLATSMNPIKGVK